MISDDIVSNVFIREEAKLLEDLVIYAKNYRNLIEQSQFEDAFDNLDNFKEPFLLLSSKNLENHEFREKYAKELYSLENFEENSYYLKSKITIGNISIPVVEFPPYSDPDNVSDELAKLKGMLIDKSRVCYRVKKPLEVQWRIPLRCSKVWNKTKEEYIQDPHNFDFTCYTLAEIHYDGPMIIWWFNDQL